MARHKKTVDEKYNQVFPARFRGLMEITQTNQTELAKAIGKSRQVVSQYCNGDSAPPYEILVKIANYFNVSIDYLLGVTDDKKRVPSVIDDLGVSDKTVKMFCRLKNMHSFDVSMDYNSVLESFEFELLIHSILNYIAASKAEEIYKRVIASYFDLTQDFDSIFGLVQKKEWDIDAFKMQIMKFAQDDTITDSVKRELLALMQLFDTQTDMDIMLSIFEGPKERASIYGYEASSLLSRLLADLKKTVQTDVPSNNEENMDTSTDETER